MGRFKNWEGNDKEQTRPYNKKGRYLIHSHERPTREGATRGSKIKDQERLDHSFGPTEMKVRQPSGKVDGSRAE